MDEKLKIEISSTALADILGITTERIRQLREKDIIPYIKKGNRYKYILSDTVKAYCENIRKEAAGRNLDDSQEKLKKEKLKAEVVLKRSQGELHMLKTAIENKEYIPVEQVESDYNNFFADFRSFARNIPQLIVNDIGSEIGERKKRMLQKKILDLIDERLNEFVLGIEPIKKKTTGRPRKTKHDG